MAPEPVEFSAPELQSEQSLPTSSPDRRLPDSLVPSAWQLPGLPPPPVCRLLDPATLGVDPVGVEVPPALPSPSLAARMGLVSVSFWWFREGVNSLLSRSGLGDLLPIQKWMQPLSIPLRCLRDARSLGPETCTSQSPVPRASFSCNTRYLALCPVVASTLPPAHPHGYARCSRT